MKTEQVELVQESEVKPMSSFFDEAEQEALDKLREEEKELLDKRGAK